MTIIFDPVFESSVTVLNLNQCFPLSCCSGLMVLLKGITIKKCARTLEAAHSHTWLLSVRVCMCVCACFHARAMTILVSPRKVSR